ncbi:integrase catalytic domain-containing protein [Trichonephila clavipes]|nr:integrase catalytic domain-containing protein [Trichonephila clavipes]
MHVITCLMKKLLEEFEKRDRKVRQFFDDFNADEKLQDKERLFEVDVFKANVDVITTQLKNRFESMNGIYKSFSFLSPKNIVSSTNDLLYNEASNLQKVYSFDLSSEFPNQIMSLKAVFSEDLIKLNSIKDLGNLLMIQNKFAVPSLPDVCIAVLLFLTLTVTSAMAEMSFSELKLIKNYLRCTMSEERLFYLSLISIEQREARKIELDELITDFVLRKIFTVHTNIDETWVLRSQRKWIKNRKKNNSNVTTEEKLNRLKDSIKGTLTKLEAFTSEKTVSKDTSVTEIEIKLKKIEQLQINLDKIARDYCEIETFESLEIIQLDIENINQRIETTEVGLRLLMYSLKNSENVNINLNDNGKNSIRLPQIPLPEFSGVIAEFSNFKNQFINLISNNEQLNDSQKLYYLRASLKGEAKLLESPSDSFSSLFSALEDRYENKRQLIDSHVLEIINYEKIYSESAKELSDLMDCINRNIRALKVLKYEQNDLSDIILINIILHKIDKESRKQFELSLKTAEVPTFDSIMKFLEKRSAVLENITRIPSTKMIHKNTAMCQLKPNRW